MNWEGETYIDEAWLLYRGRASDNSLHSHATLQLTVSLDELISISDSNGHTFKSKGIAVKPNVIHRLYPSNKLVLVLIEPQSDLSRLISSSMADQDICEIDLEFLSKIDWESPLNKLFNSLEFLRLTSLSSIDPRLTNALNHLRVLPLKGAITEAAKHSGISVSQLRAIANTQLGVPLSKWLSWNAIKRSTISLSSGSSLSKAAFDGGFSDQAHYTRTMKRIMGITPMQALKTSGKEVSD